MGPDGAGDDFVPSVTGVFLTTDPPLEVTTANVRDVSIKTTAATVVILFRNVAAPRLPKSV